MKHCTVSLQSNSSETSNKKKSKLLHSSENLQFASKNNEEHENVLATSTMGNQYDDKHLQELTVNEVETCSKDICGIDALYQVLDMRADAHLQFQWMRVHPKEAFVIDSTDDTQGKKSSFIHHNSSEPYSHGKDNNFNRESDGNAVNYSENLFDHFGSDIGGVKNEYTPTELRVELSSLFEPSIISDWVPGVHTHFIDTESECYSIEESQETNSLFKNDLENPHSTRVLSKTYLETTISDFCDIAFTKLQTFQDQLNMNTIDWEETLKNHHIGNTEFLTNSSFTDLKQSLMPSILLKEIQKRMTSASLQLVSMNFRLDSNGESKYSYELGAMIERSTLSQSICILVLQSLAFFIKTKCMGRYILTVLCPCLLQQLSFTAIQNCDDTMTTFLASKLSNHANKIGKKLAIHLRPMFLRLAEIMVKLCYLAAYTKSELSNLLYQINVEGPDMEWANELKTCVMEIYFDSKVI